MDNGLKKIIKLTENQLSKLILTEKLSSVLFHFTGLYNTYEMLKENAVYLNNAYRGASDDMHNTKKFYMCFTRQMNGKQGYSRGKNVRIEFDGDLLNQRFEGRPVDYWGDELGKQKFFRDPSYGGGGHYIKYEQNTTESEDRLFSNEPVIRDISKYIKRIDILLPLKMRNPFKKVELSNDELSIESFNNQDNVKLSNLILRYARDKVFVYVNENDFNMRNDKVINEWLLNQYYSASEIKGGYRVNNTENDLFKVLQFINYAEDINMYSDKDRKLAIGENAKLLKHYHLDRFLPSIMKLYKSYYDREFKAKDVDLKYSFDNLRQYDKEVYVLAIKMFDDFLKSHGYKNQKDVIDKKDEEYYRKNYGRGIDYDKEITLFAFKPTGNSDRYGNTIILRPNKTPFWIFFDELYKEDFIREISYYVREHGSKNDEYFTKYLKHLTQDHITVSQMLDVFKKLKLKEESFDIFENFFGGTFTYITINYFNIENERFLNDKEKQEVLDMFKE